MTNPDCTSAISHTDEIFEKKKKREGEKERKGERSTESLSPSDHNLKLNS